MSQQRRRRRRRRRGGGSSEPKSNQAGTQQQQQPKDQGQPAEATKQSSGRRRRRRGRPRGEAREAASPRSSEDLVRALPKERPKTLTAPPDGQSLDALIGELQSKYGVPQYPQEYRITLKVAEDRDARPDTAEEAEREPESPTPRTEGIKREKAPAAPLLMRGEAEGSSSTRRRRRGRRRKRRSGGSPS